MYAAYWNLVIRIIALGKLSFEIVFVFVFNSQYNQWNKQNDE